MSMLSKGSPQRVHGKGKREVEHSNSHCRRYSTDFKRPKIQEGNLPQIGVEISRNSTQTGVEISRNSKVDRNVVVQAETSRMPPTPHAKAKYLQYELTEKKVKVAGNEVKSDKMTARDAFHASDKSRTSSHQTLLAGSHSLSKNRQGVSVSRDFQQWLEGLDLPPAKSGVLTNRVSPLKPKSLVEAHKISDKQNLSSSGEKLDKNTSAYLAAQDQNKLKQVSRNETCKVAQREKNLEYKRKSKDEEDENHFSSCAMVKYQGKSLPEPTEAQQKGKESAFVTKSAESEVPKLDVALYGAVPQSANRSIIPFDEHQQDVSRDKVLMVLKQFKETYTQLLEERERLPKEQRKGSYRADLKAANILKLKGKWINCYPYIGNVPGVQIGDRFQYRAELAIIGLHLEYVCGIHYEEIDGKIYATSIVDSGRYHNQFISADEFYYMGEGGNPEVSSGLKDQTLDGGNLALKNSMESELPVRVIRGRQNHWASSDTMGINTGSGFTFFYDGLFKVTGYCYHTDSQTHKNMFKFKMVRVKEDPNLTQPRNSTMQRKKLKIDGTKHQNQKMPISAGKDVRTSKFTYNTEPSGFGNKRVYSSARYTKRNKDEKFNYEAAAALAKPIVSNRRLHANRASTMPKLG